MNDELVWFFNHNHKLSMLCLKQRRDGEMNEKKHEESAMD